MASLGTLPSELLLMIARIFCPIQHLLPNGSFKRYRDSRGRDLRALYLAALSLANRHLHHVFDPILYQWDQRHRSLASRAVPWAIHNNSLGTLKKALAAGMDLEEWICPMQPIEDRFGSLRPVILALDLQRHALLKILLEHGASPDGENVRDDPLRATDTTSALYSALDEKHGNEDAALLLLDHGARIFFAKDLKSDDWTTSVDTALHVAAKHGRTRVVKRLLQDGTIPVDMRNCRGRTPFGLAVTNRQSVAATVEVLLQHTTDPFADSKAVAAALKKGHQEHIILMLRTKSNYSHSFLLTCLKQLNFRLGHRCFSDEDYDDRGYGGYDDSLKDHFSRDIDYANPDPTPAMEVSAILAKLIELGADFDNAPPPFFKDEHEPLVSMASRHLDPFIFKTLVKLGANPLIRLQQKCDAFDINLDSNARMDFKIPATGQTIFEAAVDLCDETSKPDCECLQYLLAQATPDKLASSHVYEVLESRIVHFEKHINGCIAIMQQGWISSAAQSYMFDWLIAYITGTPVMRSGLRYDWTNVELNKKAAKFFPQFLNRERLDEFWRTSQAWEYQGMQLRQRWDSVQWMHISAERGDAVATRRLLRSDLSLSKAWDRLMQSVKTGVRCSCFDHGGDTAIHKGGDRQGWTGRDHAPTPLMRAISAGHRDVAIQLVEYGVKWKRDEKIECSHIGTYCTGILTCEICPYGQRSPYELAINRGEIELLDVLFESGIVEREYSRAKAPDLPRVLSHGNLMAEWLELKVLLFEAYCEWDAWVEADEGSPNPIFHPDRRYAAEIEQFVELRKMITEIRDAWLDRARRLKRNATNTAPYA